jgi:hypothetical protein
MSKVEVCLNGVDEGIVLGGRVFGILNNEIAIVPQFIGNMKRMKRRWVF